MDLFLTEAWNEKRAEMTHFNKWNSNFLMGNKCCSSESKCFLSFFNFLKWVWVDLNLLQGVQNENEWLYFWNWISDPTLGLNVATKSSKNLPYLKHVLASLSYGQKYTLSALKTLTALPAFGRRLFYLWMEFHETFLKPPLKSSWGKSTHSTSKNG